MKKRILALILVMSLALSMLTGCASSTAGDSSVAGTEDMSQAEAAAAEAVASAATSLFSNHSSESGKEETVYVISDANGGVEKTIVSTWLKNAEGSDTVKDQTSLSELQNVKGDGDYTDNGDGTITWDAQGQDIYYQGTTAQTLPVDVDITYELDGKTVTPEELDGASGHLKIAFQYTNNTGKKTTINGESCTIYQPFLMISGTILDNETASNVKVTNGQVINSGENSVVVGMAMPGLKESLGLDDLEDSDGEAIEVDIPEDVVIEADVTDFSLMTILTMASNNALEELELDDIDSIDDLKDSIADLTDATGELMDGADDLHEGMGDLSDGTDKLDDGVNDLNDGAQQLSDGAQELSEGLETALAGSSQLVSQGFEGKNGAVQGAKAISEGASALNKAVQSAASSSIALTDEQLAAVSKQGAAGAAAQSGTFAEGIASGITSSISAQKESIASGAAAQASGTVLEGEEAQQIVQALALGLAASQGEGAEEIDKYLPTAQEYVKQLASSVASDTAGGVADSIAASITKDSLTSTLEEPLSQLGAGIATQTAQGVVAQVNGAMTPTLQSLAEATQQLADGSAALSSGIKQLYAKTNELSSGLNTLSQGAETLSDGAGELADGTDTMDESMVDLLDGVKKLLDGTGDLVDGLDEYNEEGIQKLADLVNEDLDGFYERLKAVRDYAEEYNSFGGCLSDMDCSVKFIYKTDAIGA